MRMRPRSDSPQLPRRRLQLSRSGAVSDGLRRWTRGGLALALAAQDFHRERPFAAKRIRNEAAVLGFAEEQTGPGLVGTRWQRQSCGYREACELGRIPDVFEHPFDATLKGRPVEVRRASDAAEGQDEAVGH